MSDNNFRYNDVVNSEAAPSIGDMRVKAIDDGSGITTVSLADGTLEDWDTVDLVHKARADKPRAPKMVGN